MLTLTLSPDRLDEVQPGDRLVAIDEVALSAGMVLSDGPRRLWPNGPIGIPYEYGGGAAPAYLYPDSLVGRSITVERDDPTGDALRLVDVEDMPENREKLRALGQGRRGATEVPPMSPAVEAALSTEPAPAPLTVFLHERERKALRRNRHYEETLRLLSDPDGRAVDLRKRAPADGRWHGARHHSHQAGMLATWYGWTERVGDYTWRLTASGRRVLAVLDQQKD